MSFDERDLRAALRARSGEVTPEFRSRLAQAIERGAPRPNWMPAIALATVVVLSVASVGGLLAARNSRNISHGPPASSTRLTSPVQPSPTPIYLPTDVQLSAPSRDVVWTLVASSVLYLSTDRGQTWQQRSLPQISGGGPVQISFVDADQGWLSMPDIPGDQCITGGLTLWHTADGAKTWQRRPTSGIGARQCKQVLSFVDATHGFIS